jgi:Transposase IS66 family
VGEEAGTQTVVADPVGPQAGQAGGHARIIAQPQRRLGRAGAERRDRRDSGIASAGRARGVCARAALLTCGHYLPIGRARQLLEALTAIGMSTGFLAGVRGRAARRLEHKFLPHLRELLASAPVLHADETTARAAAALSYVHVACTEYLTLMHVGGRSSDDIDAGGVLTEFTGVLVRDGYAGYTHLPAVHAWCAGASAA